MDPYDSKESHCKILFTVSSMPYTGPTGGGGCDDMVARLFLAKTWSLFLIDLDPTGVPFTDFILPRQDEYGYGKTFEGHHNVIHGCQ